MSFFSKIKSTFFEEVDEPEREEAKNIEEITPVETFKPREEKIENVDNNRNLKRAEFTLYEDETEDDFAVAKTQSFVVVPMGIKTVAVKDEKENKEVKKEENIVDLKEEKAVPNVKNVTIEDASEYYNDLGLEYNVNYKDNRVSSVDEFSEDDEIKTTRKVEKEKTAKMLQEESDKNKKNQDPTDEEDLFNLIESMYEKDN